MARPPRLQAPGTLHHLIARGNERREVFRDDVDREDYLDRIARYGQRFGLRVFAYCLMPNHVHLAVQQGSRELSAFMHVLQSSYTLRFNQRHVRVGHLFQGRYKSFLVDSERYFVALIRYIHNNPVKAGLASETEVYRWSSDRFFRSGTGPPWLDLDGALALLGPSRSIALRRYRTLMKEAGAQAGDYEAVTVYEASVKGDEEFALRALRQVPLPRRRSRVWTPENVGRSVAACYGLTVEDLAGPARRHALSECRIVAAYLARARLAIPVSAMARLFRREETGLAHGVRSLEERMSRDPDLKKRVDRIANNAKLPA